MSIKRIRITILEGSVQLGFAEIEVDGTANGSLEQLWVAPEYRQQGLGSKLVEDAVTLAKHHRVTNLHLIPLPATLDPETNKLINDGEVHREVVERWYAARGFIERSDVQDPMLIHYGTWVRAI